MSGMFDRGVITEVQQASDIAEVIAEHVNLTKKGREMVGLCPFHDDHRPSMYVNSVKQIFKCFACGAGGGVFTFVQMRENLTFPQAVERLAQRAGIKIKPAKTTKRRPRGTSADIEPNRLAKVNDWATKYFQQNLKDKQKGKYARDYIKERQITDQSVKYWGIGLAVSGNDLISSARAKNIPTELLLGAGLIVGKAGSFADKFVTRLMFPITDVTGRVIGFGGRALDGADAKYINSPTTALFDKSNSLYGLAQARPAVVSGALAVVVEGYTDVIMAHSKGCGNVVATLGTSFTTGHGRILRRYAKKVVLLFDSDTAGIEAANKALDVCLSLGIDIKIALIPEGKDPCDFLLSAGKEPFDQLIEQAVDVLQFRWNRLTENFGAKDNLIDNKAAVEEFLQTIATSLRSGSLSAIDRGLIINRLSKIIGLDANQINAELGKRLARAQRIAGYNVENQKAGRLDLGQGLFAAAQREILEVLLNEPALFDIVKQSVTPEDFDVPLLRQIADILFETLSTEPAATLAEILAKAESAEVSASVVKLAQTGEDKGNFQSRLTGALDAIQRLGARRKTSEIKAIENETQFLRNAYENTDKQNPHNVGMV